MMRKSFDDYYNRNSSILKVEKTKLEKEEFYLYATNNALETPGMKSRETASFLKKKEKLEKKIAELKTIIQHLEALSENPDALVVNYLASLPINRKAIDLSDEFENHSLTTVPDLSRFPCLTKLNMSNNRLLSSGFDRLPTTLEHLNLYKTDIANEDTEWIQRLVNIEMLVLSRNDRIRELPDLSGLTKLKHLRVPNEGLSKYFTKTCCDKIRYSHNGVYNWNYSVSHVCKTNSEVAQLIRNINYVNRFEKIREELLATAARIVMNPTRIERLLDQAEIDLDSDWSDIFEFQKKRTYGYAY